MCQGLISSKYFPICAKHIGAVRFCFIHFQVDLNGFYLDAYCVSISSTLYPGESSVTLSDVLVWMPYISSLSSDQQLSDFLCHNFFGKIVGKNLHMDLTPLYGSFQNILYYLK